MSSETELHSSRNVLLGYRRGLFKVAIFDEPLLEDAKFLLQQLNDFIDRNVICKTIVDLRALRVVDPAPFALLAEFIMHKQEFLIPISERTAFIHDGSMAAATVSGAITMYLGQGIAVKTFTDATAAFAWCGLDDAQLQDFEERIARFRATPTILNRCRAYLAEHFREASLASCAASLDTSEADLHVELTKASTSFRSELREARLEAAQALLRDTDQTTSAVALAVGYRKQQNFSDAFRKATGMTPTAWRKHQRLSRV